MSITPYQALDEFLTSLDKTDPTKPLEKSAILRALEPFLLNPERHREHLNVFLEASEQAGALRAFAPLFKLIDSWFFRVFARLSSTPHPRDILDRQRAEFRQKVQDLSGDLRETVQPGELTIDLLPVRALETDPSWKALGMQLVAVEARTRIRPKEGFRVQRAAFELQFEAVPPVQVVSARTETEFEVLGDRELTTGASGKRMQSHQKTDEGSIGAKALGYEANLKFIDVSAQSTEYAQSVSATLKDRPTVPRISCDAVGSTAHWDLYSTPNYTPAGGLTFETRILVNRSLRNVAVKSFLAATFISWGLVETRTSKSLDLVFRE